MQVLIVAYEFPPIQSGQSLRWYYLANELAKLGVSVHVVAPHFANVHGFGGGGEAAVAVHRTFAGPYIGLANKLAERSATSGGRSSGPPASGLTSLYRVGRRVLDRILFPDLRTEWLPFAWSKMSSLLAARRFDAIVTSHEPGVTLLLGLLARRRWNLPWLADIGDPVVDLRTPAWRRPLDLRLERAVCRRADHVTVTCDATADLLVARHAATCVGLEQRLSVISQGFPVGESRNRGPQSSDSRFVLVCTGTLYPRYRPTGPLCRALETLADEDLTVLLAGEAGESADAFKRSGARVEMLGMIDHQRCLEIQRNATVLLDIGDVRRHLMPGRVYEYLGAGRPILHLSTAQDDPAAKLVRGLRRGIVADNESEAITAALRELLGAWRSRRLDDGFDLSMAAVAEHSWPTLAGRLLAAIERITPSR